MVQSTAEGEVLSELWTRGVAPVFGPQSATGLSWPDSGMSLPSLSGIDLNCGWNGPYVLRPSNGKLYDGFGNDFLAAQTNSPLADPGIIADWYKEPGVSGEPTIGDTICGVLSRGSDGTFATNSWDEENIAVLFDVPQTTLEVRIRVQDYSGGSPQWVPVETNLIVWTASQPYAVGQWVVDSLRTNVFRCTFPGTSGTNEPTWNTGNIGALTTNATTTVVWEYRGTISDRPREINHYINRLRVALFIPDVDRNTADVGWVMAELDDTNVQSSITLSNGAPNVTSVPTAAAITPGVRKIYAYGFLDGQTTPLTSGKEPETIELKPGQNFITLYLR
jgi:hypothetical protein